MIICMRVRPVNEAPLPLSPFCLFVGLAAFKYSTEFTDARDR